jgi:hypothetical protein
MEVFKKWWFVSPQAMWGDTTPIRVSSLAFGLCAYDPCVQEWRTWVLDRPGWERSRDSWQARLRGSCHKLSPASWGEGGYDRWEGKRHMVPEPWIALVEEWVEAAGEPASAAAAASCHQLHQQPQPPYRLSCPHGQLQQRHSPLSHLYVTFLFQYRNRTTGSSPKRLSWRLAEKVASQKWTPWTSLVLHYAQNYKKSLDWPGPLWRPEAGSTQSAAPWNEFFTISPRINNFVYRTASLGLHFWINGNKCK